MKKIAGNIMAALSLVLVLSSIRHLPVVAAPELRDQSATPADAQMQLATPGNAKYYATDDCVDDTLPPDITEVSCIEADLLDEADTAVFPELEAAELPIKTASPSNADRAETENAM